MAPYLFLALFLIQAPAHDSDRELLRISETLIAEHTTYFDIRDNRFEGADTLLAALERAHFVALGELHNRIRLGELTEALLHTLEPHGFSHFAVETGPYSARKLQQLMRSGKPDVSAFYAQYSSRLIDLIPIPFFKGKGDLRFLAAADSLGFDLWGLDQEYYFSYAFLIDDLAGLAEQNKASEPIRINYFRENFDLHYKAVLAESPEPRVFLKMGSFHMGRQRSPLNLYDMGNHIHRLAESQGQSSVHIRYLNRFFEGKDMKGRRGWEGSDRFLSVGDREKWALIDLRPLRDPLSSGTLRGNDFEEHTILNYDFIIIAPKDDWVKRHW